MDRNSNIYTIIYAAIVTVIVAIALAFAHSSLEPKMLENEKLATQKDILRSVGLDDLPNTAEVYDKTITSLVIDANGKVVEGVAAEKVSMAAENKKPEADQLHPYLYIPPMTAAKSISCRFSEMAFGIKYGDMWRWKAILIQ